MQALYGILGIVLGIGANAMQEHYKTLGYGKVAFSIGKFTFGWDDVSIIGIGAILVFIKPLRWTGLGLIAGMGYTKLADAYPINFKRFSLD